MGGQTRAILFGLAAIVWFASDPLAARAQFIPMTNRKDHVFDPVSRILYIATTAGTVARYDTTTQSFLDPWTIGGTLGGIDVTPDGATVLVADRTYDTTTDLGLVHRVSAATGVITTLQFALDALNDGFTETGAWDVVAMSNSKAFFTADFVGSSSQPLHEWNLDTNGIVNRGSSLFTFNEIDERTWLFRSSNRATMLALESDTSAGTVFTYDTASDTFLARKNLGFFPGEPARGIFHADGMGAVSRDGQWVAIEVAPANETWILDRNLSSIVARLPLILGGIFFHPHADVLYGLDTVGDDVVTYDTHTWAEIGRMDAGGNLIGTIAFTSGLTSFDSSRNILFASVQGGIVGIQLTAPDVPGDYDGNGSVGPEDYDAWRAAFGSTSAMADGNGNGIVDAADYTIWRDNYAGMGGAGALTNSVPEPHAAALVLVALTTLLAGWRKQC